VTSAALEALADPTRREIVAELARAPRSAGDVAKLFPISQPAVSRHLRVLRESGLVEQSQGAGDGRVRVYRLRPEPLEELTAWLDDIRSYWQTQLGSFREYVESRP
jgi:DNA-binding transcriptional ArsR family regulator